MGRSIYKPAHKRGSVGRSLNPKKEHDGLYDYTWKQYRIEFLKHNPRCYSCGSKASEVDHVEAHKGNIVLFKKLDNHIPLCISCHSTVTMLFDVRDNKTVQDKIEWLNKKRAELNLNFRVKVLPTYE